MASLIITSGDQEGRFYPLGRRTHVIGRDEALLIQILDNLVSRKHMQIRYDEKTQKHCVFDMKSSNGVYVNQNKITGETVLVDDDVISIGKTSLLFTEKDFDDRDSAFRHYRKAGERMRVTSYEPRESRIDQ